jgi:hypothetical protein
MIPILIGRLTKVRTHPVSNDRKSTVCKSLNAILKSARAEFESGYIPARFCLNKVFTPAAIKQIDFEPIAAYKIGLVGCLECFREPGIYNWTAFEISTKLVHVVCTLMENSRKVLWLRMTGLVERSLELRLALPFA